MQVELGNNEMRARPQAELEEKEGIRIEDLFNYLFYVQYNKTVQIHFFFTRSFLNHGTSFSKCMRL